MIVFRSKQEKLIKQIMSYMTKDYALAILTNMPISFNPPTPLEIAAMKYCMKNKIGIGEHLLTLKDDFCED